MVKWIRDSKLPNPLGKLGMNFGFFQRYAETFWNATGMELDIVYDGGEPWESVAQRIRGSFCRDVALHPGNAELCRKCFLEACRKARSSDHFITMQCHAGQKFSVLLLGELEGAQLLLLAGRAKDADSREYDADSSNKSRSSPRTKSTVEYQSALDLIYLSLPYLRIKLEMDLLLAVREFPPLVRMACQYVDEHFRESITVASVAAACGVSEDYLSHLFSKHAGHPLSRYIVGVRIGHAIYLLREEKSGIAEIAFEVGFQSLSQFNRSFKALQKMTPGEFRRRELGSAEK